MLLPASMISTILIADELMSVPINGGIFALNRRSSASKLTLNFPFAINVWGHYPTVYIKCYQQRFLM